VAVHQDLFPSCRVEDHRVLQEDTVHLPFPEEEVHRGNQGEDLPDIQEEGHGSQGEDHQEHQEEVRGNQEEVPGNQGEGLQDHQEVRGSREEDHQDRQALEDHQVRDPLVHPLEDHVPFHPENLRGHQGMDQGVLLEASSNQERGHQDLWEVQCPVLLHLLRALEELPNLYQLHGQYQDWLDQRKFWFALPQGEAVLRRTSIR